MKTGGEAVGMTVSTFLGRGDDVCGNPCPGRRTVPTLRNLSGFIQAGNVYPASVLGAADPIPFVFLQLYIP